LLDFFDKDMLPLSEFERFLFDHMIPRDRKGIAQKGHQIMTERPFYHGGMVELQEKAGGRRVAEFLATNVRHRAFTEEDKAFVEAAGFFLIATSFNDVPDCSFKGGNPGFVKVTGESTLEFPDYDGNLMFRTLGNIIKNPNVALLFIAIGANPKRLRINGQATIVREPERLSKHTGAQAVIEVLCLDLFPNCPRYIPDPCAGTQSIYNPRESVTAPVPAWKTFPGIAPLLPDGDSQREQINAMQKRDETLS
jgi:predicted pyridoxine 5'-phosphate oxidase superfamily flavin-nucleotide-binding protein